MITNIEKLCEKTVWYTERAHAANSLLYVKNRSWTAGHPTADYKYNAYDNKTQYDIIRTAKAKQGDVVSLLFNGYDWTLSYLFNAEIRVNATIPT